MAVYNFLLVSNKYKADEIMQDYYSGEENGKAKIILLIKLDNEIEGKIYFPQILKSMNTHIHRIWVFLIYFKFNWFYATRMKL